MRVRELRLERKLSQEALAELADVHVNLVGRVERGGMSAGIITVLKLAVALKTTPSELFAPFDSGLLRRLRLSRD